MTKVMCVGAFPPPVHGMAMVNAAVRDQLCGTGIDLQVIDLSAPNLERSLYARLRRLPKVLLGLWYLMLIPQVNGCKLYMSVSGGFGQIYELLFVSLARMRGMQVVLHHHSFAYLNARKLIAQALIISAGPSAVHIALSLRMAERLQTVYKTTQVISISNAAFLLSNETLQIKPRLQPRTLGFISNITVEKGIPEFLNLMVAIQAKNLPLKAKIAGPFQDSQTESNVRTYLEILYNVEYVGPKYGADKDEFFAGIDILLFPTRYKNEAEPLIIHEAMSRGIPVVAYGRGCIPEIIEANCGLVVPPADDFVSAALAQICTWIDSPQTFQDTSIAAAERFEALCAESLKSWEGLKTKMVQGDFS